MEEEWKNDDGPRKVIIISLIVLILGITVWGMIYGFRRTACPTETDPKVRLKYGCAEETAH